MVESLIIVIPAYNEELNIKKVVKGWHNIASQVSSGKLLIIDDSSTDNTFKILSELKQEFPLLEVIKKENGGHGAAILYGYKYALEHGYDYIFQTDSDNQTNPDEFKYFWELREKYSAIIGHRTNRKDGISRVIVTNVLKLVLFLFFGINIPDANAPFRLMKANVLKRYISKIPEDYNLTNVLLSLLFMKNKETVKFLPITFQPRSNGKNFMNFNRIFKIGIKTVRDFYVFKNKI